jgi:hypothetical protein
MSQMERTYEIGRLLLGRRQIPHAIVASTGLTTHRANGSTLDVAASIFAFVFRRLLFFGG